MDDAESLKLDDDWAQNRKKELESRTPLELARDWTLECAAADLELLRISRDQEVQVKSVVSALGHFEKTFECCRELMESVGDQLTRIADTSEQVVGIRTAENYHVAALNHASSVFKIIVCPDGISSSLISTDRDEDGVYRVAEENLEDGWPRVRKLLRETDLFDFERLQVLLLQEAARAIGDDWKYFKTIRQISDYVGVDESTIRRWFESGKLSKVRDGGLYKLSKSTLHSLMKSG